VLGVDGGNSKTDAVLATLDGEPLAYVRGPGSNSHGRGGSAGCANVIADLVARLPFDPPAERAAFFLCGADAPEDIRELTAEIDARAWTRTDRRQRHVRLAPSRNRSPGRGRSRLRRRDQLRWPGG
jgi:N-acetylglucosamine kinase-like BadF-type ATPase